MSHLSVFKIMFLMVKKKRIRMHESCYVCLLCLQFVITPQAQRYQTMILATDFSIPPHTLIDSYFIFLISFSFSVRNLPCLQKSSLMSVIHLLTTILVECLQDFNSRGS